MDLAGLGMLPEFMESSLKQQLEPATYVDQLKPRKRKQAAEDPSAKEGLDDEPEEAELPKAAVPKKQAKKAARKPTKKRKTEELEEGEPAAVELPAPKETRVNPARGTPCLVTSETPRATAEDPEDPMCDPGDDAVRELVSMEAARIKIVYSTSTTPDWVTSNNVYSSAYRKAVQKAKLTKPQAQLRGRVASGVWRVEGLIVDKLCLPFHKPRPRKARKGDDKGKTTEAPDADEAAQARDADKILDEAAEVAPSAPLADA